MGWTKEDADQLEHRIQTEPTQSTFYRCETAGCPREGIAHEIREFRKTGKPVYPPATMCDGAGCCGKRWTRMKDTTVRE